MKHLILIHTSTSPNSITIYHILLNKTTTQTPHYFIINTFTFISSKWNVKNFQFLWFFKIFFSWKKYFFKALGTLCSLPFLYICFILPLIPCRQSALPGPLERTFFVLFCFLKILGHEERLSWYQCLSRKVFQIISVSTLIRAIGRVESELMKQFVQTLFFRCSIEFGQFFFVKLSFGQVPEVSCISVNSSITSTKAAWSRIFPFHNLLFTFPIPLSPCRPLPLAGDPAPLPDLPLLELQGLLLPLPPLPLRLWGRALLLPSQVNIKYHYIVLAFCHPPSPLTIMTFLLMFPFLKFTLTNAAIAPCKKLNISWGKGAKKSKNFPKGGGG